MLSKPVLLVVLMGALCPFRALAHHEAIFGPQSAALLSHPRFVSTQYYFSNEGQRPADLIHSNIGILSVAAPLRPGWSLSASLPFEIQGGSPDAVQGIHDPVFGVRYTPDVGKGRILIGTLTLEPPASSLEVRAFGTGGGVLYGVERGHWSGIAYTLARTEHSFQDGVRRGNRLFMGGGAAFEARRLPFSPQLGMSWEHTTPRIEGGQPVQDSRSSVLMLHPTVVKTFRDEHISTFLVFSVPAAQWSGNEGWQRWRIGTGIVWSF